MKKKLMPIFFSIIIVAVFLIIIVAMLMSGYIEVITGERILVSYETNGNGITIPYGDHHRAQTFTPDGDWTITKISLQCKLGDRNDEPGYIDVDIMEVDAGGPDGTSLASASFNGDNLDTDAEWIDFLITLVVESGVEYAIVIEVPDANATDDQAEFTIDLLDGFIDGDYYYSIDDGDTWGTIPGDMYFRVYGLP